MVMTGRMSFLESVCSTLRTTLPGLTGKVAHEDQNTDHSFGLHVCDWRRIVYELVQNATDQYRRQAGIASMAGVDLQVLRFQHGFRIRYDHRDLGVVCVLHGGIFIINQDTQMPRDAFTHGYSDKKAKTGEDYFLGGMFGDGLKVVCAGLAREGLEAGFYSGRERMTFTYRAPAGGRTQRLMLCREELVRPVRDLITYAYIGEEHDIMSYLQTNFLLFGKTQVLTRSSVGRILRHLPSGGPRLCLHGIAFSVPEGCIEGEYWDKSELVFDLTLSTPQAVDHYGLGRDRRLNPDQVECMAGAILRACMLEDDRFFDHCIDVSLGKVLTAWQANKTSILRSEDKSGIWPLVNRLYFLGKGGWDGFSRQRVADKLYHSLRKKLGVEFVMVEKNEQYKGMASILGPQRLVLLTGDNDVVRLLKYTTNITSIEDLSERLRDVVTRNIVDCKEGDDLWSLLCHVRDIVRRLYPDCEVVPARMASEDLCALPVVHLDDYLYVDLEAIQHYQESTCTAANHQTNAVCGVCVGMAVLKVLQEDATGYKCVTTETLARELARQFAATTTLPTTTKKRKTPAPATATSTTLKTKPTSHTTPKTAPRPTKQQKTTGFSWKDVQPQDSDLLSLFRRAGALAPPASGGGLPDRVEGHTRPDSRGEDHTCRGGKESVTLVRKNNLYFPEEDTQEADLSREEDFRELILRLKTRVAGKLPWLTVPDVRVMYCPDWDVFGFHQAGVIYLNLAPYTLNPQAFGKEREWLKTLLHEIAHLVEGDHNARFADIVQELTMCVLE